MPRLFEEMAELWPLLSPPDDYIPEANSVDRVLSSRLVGLRSKPRVLEMGAGGGHTLHHLMDRYQMVALDLSTGMLENCQRLNPGVETIVGDMRDVRLSRTFEAVLIHDSVDYLVDKEEVCQSLDTAAAHLNSGGVVIVAPTYVQETFVEHDAEHDHHSDGETELTYFSYVHRLGNDSRKVEAILVYLIRRNGRVELVEDRHVGGLFSTQKWIEMLRLSGFQTEQDYLIIPENDADPGVPMFVGTKK